MRSNAVGGGTRTLCLAWEVAIMMPLQCIISENVRFKSKKSLYLLNSTDVKVLLMINNQPMDISDKLQVLPSQQKRGRSKQA